MKLFLIGYEGSNSECLVQTLINVGIEVLADVRELPLSRKKGLSKTGLSNSLEEVGIAYRHFRDLGDPKAGRDAAKAGDFGKFERIFTLHLESAPAQAALDDLLEMACKKSVCLLCFERCSNTCHRSYIADIAHQRGFEVFNLVADRPEAYLNDNFTIPRYDPRKSLTPAE